MSPSDESSDRELVEAANAGEAAAFEALYRRHRDWTWSLARRFTREPSEAADVLQEAFLHFWTRFPGFVLTAQLRSYLYPVVRHIALERRRRGSRYLSAGDRDGRGEREDPFVAAPGDEREELSRVLALLPPAQREVVLMRFVDDLELAEIAAALEIPLGTVKSRLHTALGRLREDPATRAYFLD